MKTEEAKLKRSLKKMPTSSETANCAARVPMLLRNGEKAKTPYVSQPKVPKPKDQSSCTRIKNPWIVRSSVAFTLVIVVVVFASLHSKHGTELSSTNEKISELENLVQILQQTIVDLEIRVRCATSENGTDSGGNPCPAGGPGNLGYLKNRRKGESGDRVSPTKKTQKDKKRKEELKKSSVLKDSQRSSQRSAKQRKRQSTVYMHWGSSKCPNTSETTWVYSGRVASAYSSSDGSGSEFLCLPDKPIYTTPKNISKDSVYMVLVKYGKDMNVFRKIGPEDIGRISPDTYQRLMKSYGINKTLDNKYVPCSMCRSERRTTAVVMPASNVCYPYWRKEYHGYLMSQHKGNSKSQFICVDADADGLQAGQGTDQSGPLLQPTAYKCQGSSWCSESSYSSSKALTCVVCTI